MRLRAPHERFRSQWAIRSAQLQRIARVEVQLAEFIRQSVARSVSNRKTWSVGFSPCLGSSLTDAEQEWR